MKSTRFAPLLANPIPCAMHIIVIPCQAGGTMTPSTSFAAKFDDFIDISPAAARSARYEVSGRALCALRVPGGAWAILASIGPRSRQATRYVSARPEEL